MKLDLNLNEINLGIFRKRLDTLDLTPPHEVNSFKEKVPRYFEITKLVCYENISKLINRVNSGPQLTRCLWVPNGPISKEKAISRTLGGDKEYLRFLPGIAEEYGEFYAQTSSKLKKTLKINTFRFKRDNGFWYLAVCSISDRNFGAYGCFRNIRPKLDQNNTSSLEAISKLG